MDKFNEPGYEPAAMTSEEFTDYCLDLYDDIKFGKRKARKRAAQTLVLCATRLEENLGTALRKVQSLKNDISMLEGTFASAKREPIRSGASLWPTIEEARSCVINEHAHGDDHHFSGDNPWAHTDPMVNAKVVCQDTEPCDPALPKEKAPGSKRGGSPS